MPSKVPTMQNNHPVGRLLARYPLQDVIFILEALEPLFSEQGKACLPLLESELATRPPGIRSSTSTWSSGRSGQSSQSSRSLASPLFGRSSSGMGFSDVSSIAESAHSGFAPETDNAHGIAQPGTAAGSSQRKGQAYGRAHRVAKPTLRTAAASASSSPILSPRKPSFECPFCWELKIPTSISRKADLKRHFKQFHQNNAQWICQERGCSMAFDWKSAFEGHLKESHGNPQHPSDSHQVKLCPQVVFACGFSNCRLVFEASNDEEAEKKAQEYFNHVANHFDDNLTHRNWSHSVRIRNLMRQTAVDAHWKERKKGAQDPVWQPHTTSVVRKILETRHFTDIPLLVQWVVNLGSFAFSQPHSPLPKLPAELRLPVKETCTIALDGHGPLPRRDSHRHMSVEYTKARQKEPAETEPEVEAEAGPPGADSEPGHNAELEPEQEPEPEPEPELELELEPKPEPEPKIEQEMEPIEVEYHHPPTTSQHHDPLPVPSFGADLSYHPYHQHGHLMAEMHAQQHHMVGTTAAGTHSLMDQSVQHWLGITEPPQNLPLQPHLDAIIGYNHGNGMLTSDYRPVTPAHLLLGSQTHSHPHSHAHPHSHSHPHSYAGGAMIAPPPPTTSHQPSTIAPVDLEMNDCPYEPDAHCF